MLAAGAIGVVFGDIGTSPLYALKECCSGHHGATHDVPSVYGVLSAVEGVTVVAPLLQHVVLPIAIGVLVGLFMIQRHGTGKIGSLFAPVMTAWFLVLGVLGVRAIVQQCEQQGLVIDMMATTFFFARETLTPSTVPGMALWREKVFAWMKRSAESATVYYKIPPNRVIELGTQVEI